MSVDDWKKDESGNIIVRPLVSFEPMVAASTICLRLDYANPVDQLRKPSGNLQLVLTTSQATELLQALIEALDTIDPPSWGSSR